MIKAQYLERKGTKLREGLQDSIAITLCRGEFLTQIHMLKMLTRSKIKDSVVNSYNMLIAADPALTCFMQSSPFYQGEYIGKDSRVIMYRGGKPLNNMKYFYANFQQFEDCLTTS